MSIERIARTLERRPGPERLREQLFWLVDLVYACKASGESILIAHAALVEEALGLLGTYLETGDDDCLQQAGARMSTFARVIDQAMAAQGDAS